MLLALLSKGKASRQGQPHSCHCWQRKHSFFTQDALTLPSWPHGPEALCKVSQCGGTPLGSGPSSGHLRWQWWQESTWCLHWCCHTLGQIPLQPPLVTYQEDMATWGDGRGMPCPIQAGFCWSESLCFWLDVPMAEGRSPELLPRHVWAAFSSFPSRGRRGVCGATAATKAPFLSPPWRQQPFPSVSVGPTGHAWPRWRSETPPRPAARGARSRSAACCPPRGRAARGSPRLPFCGRASRRLPAEVSVPFYILWRIGAKKPMFGLFIFSIFFFFFFLFCNRSFHMSSPRPPTQFLSLPSPGWSPLPPAQHVALHSFTTAVFLSEPSWSLLPQGLHQCLPRQH